MNAITITITTTITTTTTTTNNNNNDKRDIINNTECAWMLKRCP